MPTASPVAAPRVSSAKMLTRLLEQSGQHAAGEAAHAFRFQRQDVSHLRSFLTYALGVMSDTGVYEDDIRASLSDCNVSDAASMQQALYKLFCLRGGEGLCTLLLHYVAILSESPADGGGVGPGRKTSGLSATTLEHKVRRLALFVRLQATTTGSTTPTNLLDKHHPVWGKLHAAVHRSHSEESNKAARAAASQQQAQANAAAPWYHDGAVQHGTTMALLAAAQGASAALPPHAGAWFPGLGGPLPPAAVAQLLLYAQHPLLPAHLQHLQHAVLAGAPGLSLPPLGGADGLQATAPGSPYPHPYPLDYPGAHAALYAAAVLPQLPSGAAAEGGHTAALDSDAVLGGSVGSPSAGSCSTGTRGEAAAAATGAAPAAAPVPAAAGSSRPDVKRSRSQADDGLPVAPMPMPMRVAMPAGASDDNGSEDASTQRGKAARLAPGPGTGLGCDSRERVGNGESGPHAAAGGSTFRAIGGGGCEWHSGSTVDAGASAGGAQLPVERANTPPLLVAAAAMALALQQQAARQQKGPGGQEGGCEEVRRTADGGAGSAAGGRRPMNDGLFPSLDCGAQCISGDQQTTPTPKASPAPTPTSVASPTPTPAPVPVVTTPTPAESPSACTMATRCEPGTPFYYCTAPGMSADASGGCRTMAEGPFPYDDCGAQCISGEQQTTPTPVAMPTPTPTPVASPTPTPAPGFLACGAALALWCGPDMMYLCVERGTLADATGGCREMIQGPFPIEDCGAQCISGDQPTKPTPVAAPTPTPTPVAAPTPTPTPVASPTPTPTPVASPTPTAGSFCQARVQIDPVWMHNGRKVLDC
ncbi:hypothetical protein FOA52_008617 [Chlamydomonas sp. UWO 241]|nr:hypothetical protein FOA52_008617 [Chlamydomonas sp. UWO 241]